MAVERRSSMAGIQRQVSQLLGWPAAQLRWIGEQVASRLEVSNQATRARHARARAENAAKVSEMPPTSSPTTAGEPPT
jgi:hypothetical protein